MTDNKFSPLFNDFKGTMYSRVGRFWNCKKNNAVKVAK